MLREAEREGMRFLIGSLQPVTPLVSAAGPDAKLDAGDVGFERVVSNRRRRRPARAPGVESAKPF
jgi:hypothetical protein